MTSTWSLNRSLRPKNILKTVFLGETGVGKSSLLTRLTWNKFDEKNFSTIGCAYTQLINFSPDYKVDIWDTAGQERYHSISRMYYREAVLAVIMFNVKKKNTFKRAKKWIDELVANTFGVEIILVGNKIDLLSNEQSYYFREEVTNYARNRDVALVDISVKTEQGLEELKNVMRMKLDFANKAATHKREILEKNANYKPEGNDQIYILLETDTEEERKGRWKKFWFVCGWN